MINTSVLFSSFLLITILSMLVERCLALFFEQKAVAVWLCGKGIKEVIALAVCWVVCNVWNVDVISSILEQPARPLGIFLTAAAIAGGSKASIVLFKDVIGASASPKS